MLLLAFSTPSRKQLHGCVTKSEQANKEHQDLAHDTRRHPQQFKVALVCCAVKTMDAEGTAKGEGDRARVVYVNVNTMNEKPGMTFSEAYSAKVVTVII